MSAVEFTIVFHTPFRVSTGHARAGVDAAIDIHDPLPSTSIKGLMRATAEQLLGEGSEVVQQVFGSPRYESPWRWSRAVPGDSGWHPPQPAARVAIDPDTHTASPDMFGVSEQTGAEHARFSVTQRGHLDADTLHQHRLVLAVSGQAIRSLGGGRRRGLGWVSITCTNVHLDEAAVAAFLALGAS